MRSFPYTKGSISQRKKLSGAGNPQSLIQVPQLDWFQSLQQQYVASDENLNSAGEAASTTLTHELISQSLKFSLILMRIF